MDLTESLRALVARSEQSPSVLARGCAKAARRAAQVARTLRALAIDPEARTNALLSVLRPGEVHQTSTVTFPERYPEVFACCRALLTDGRDRRVLSFGCSTGEEVVALRSWLPDAHIVGAEINPRCRAACRRHGLDERVVFVDSKPRLLARYAPFDLILCMAVLQRTPHLVEAQGLRSLARHYSFARFSDQVQQLDGLLRVGGFFVVRFTQYRFSDLEFGHRYQPVWPGPAEPTDTPYFDRESRRTTLQAPLPTIWEKMA